MESPLLVDHTKVAAVSENEGTDYAAHLLLRGD